MPKVQLISALTLTRGRLHQATASAVTICSTVSIIFTFFLTLAIPNPHASWSGPWKDVLQQNAWGQLAGSLVCGEGVLETEVLTWVLLPSAFFSWWPSDGRGGHLGVCRREDPFPPSTLL